MRAIQSRRSSRSELRDAVTTANCAVCQLMLMITRVDWGPTLPPREISHVTDLLLGAYEAAPGHIGRDSEQGHGTEPSGSKKRLTIPRILR